MNIATEISLFLQERKERKVQEAEIMREVYRDIINDGINHDEAVDIMFHYKDAILEGI